MKFKNVLFISIACLGIGLTSCNIGGPNRDHDLEQNENQNDDILRRAYENVTSRHIFIGSYEDWYAFISGDDSGTAVQDDDSHLLYELYREKNPSYTQSYEIWCEELFGELMEYKMFRSVIFNSKGGSEVPRQTVKVGEKPVEPEAPTKEGYSFVGWEYQGEIIDLSTYYVSTNVILEAVWDINFYTININYANDDTSDVLHLQYNSTFNLDDASKEGFTFLGWLNEDTNKLVTFPLQIKEDLNLVAKYNDSVLIRFNTNGGHRLDSMSVKIGSTIDSLPSPLHDSANFINWSILENGVAKDLSLPLVISGNESITLIANWKDVTKDFEYKVINDEITIIGYKGSDTEIVIPPYINNLPVTHLAKSVFKGNTNITSIRMSSIEEIENEALSDCTNLTSVDFGNKVNNYGINTLLNDKKLNTLYFGLDCPLLKLFDYDVSNVPLDMNFKIHYKENIEKPEAFTNLDTLNINSIELLDGFERSIDFQGLKMKSFIMCNSIKETIKNNFSNCTRLENVTLSKKLKKLEEYSFSHCDKLKSISLPNGILEVGCYAFHYCINLVEIGLPDSITTIGSGAFYGCESLKELELPKQLVDFGSSAINFTGITKLVLPDSLTRLNTDSLSNDGLAAVYVPKSVTEISFKTNSPDEYAYKGVIYYEGGKYDWKELNYHNNPTIVNSYKTYYDCESLTAVEKTNDYFKYFELAPNEILITDYLRDDVVDVNIQEMFPDATYVEFYGTDMFKNKHVKKLTLHDTTKLLPDYIFYSATIDYLDLKNVKKHGHLSLQYASIETLYIPATYEIGEITDCHFPNIYVESKEHLNIVHRFFNYNTQIYYVGPKSDLIGPNGEELYPGVIRSEKPAR